MTTHRTIHARGMVRGQVTAPALVCQKPLAFMGDVDMNIGTIIARGHEHEGRSIAGQILVYPETKGSSGGCVVLNTLARYNHQPAAIVLVKPADPNIVEGAILSRVALVCQPDYDVLTIPTGTTLTIDGSAGTITFTE